MGQRPRRRLVDRIRDEGVDAVSRCWLAPGYHHEEELQQGALR